MRFFTYFSAIMLMASIFLPGLALAQAAAGVNPFARPAPPAPVVAQPVVPAPSLPPNLLGNKDDDLRDDLESMVVVAVSGSSAVLRDNNRSIFVRDGGKVTLDGQKLKAHVSGNKLRLTKISTNKDKEKKEIEVFSGEVGNIVALGQTSSKPAKN